MSFLADTHIGAGVISTAATSDNAESAIKEIIAILFWKWFDSNKDKNTKIHIWIFSKTVSIGDLKGVFELIFGKRVDP